MAYNTTYCVTCQAIPLYMGDGKEAAFKLILELMAGITHSDEYKPFTKFASYIFWKHDAFGNQIKIPTSVDYYTSEMTRWYVDGTIDYRLNGSFKKPKELNLKVNDFEYYAYKLGATHAEYDKIKSVNFKGYYF